MLITETAIARIAHLSPDGPFKFSTHGSLDQGFHVDLVANAEPLQFDVTISSDPWIIADLTSVSHLSGRTVDVVDDEFIITNRT
jgi:hypothetical protein